MRNHIQNKNQIFRYLLILTGFFVVIELSVFVQASHFYLGDYDFIADKVKIPASVIPGILQFIFAQILIHLVYATGIYGIVKLMSLVSNKILQKSYQISLWLWVLGIVTILLANQLQFPNSTFSILTKTIIP